MALKTRVQPIIRDLELFLSEDLGAKAHSAILAAFAAETIEEAKTQNKQGLAPFRHTRSTSTARGRAAHQRQAGRRHPRRVPTGQRGAGLDQHATADALAGADRALCQVA